MVVDTPAKAPHEHRLLQLNCDRAWRYLKWRPTWHYEDSVEATVLWYKAFHERKNVAELTCLQIEKYESQLRENINAGNSAEREIR